MAFRTRSTSEGGFSLIEVAIALTVIGVLTASFLSLYNVYMSRKKENDTRDAIITVEAALNKYAVRYGRYPRPAHPNIAIGTVGYGREAVTVTTVCAPAVLTACRSTGAGTVLYGSIPFATLGIHYSKAMDAYGQKLMYAVTANLANPSLPFNNDGGDIRVLNAAGGQVFTGAAGSRFAHYFVYSAGRDGEGAFGPGTTRIAPCGTTAPAGTDRENCNGDNVFRSNIDMNPANVTTFNKIVRNYVAGAAQFDDWSGYKNTVTAGLWTISPSLGDLINTNTGNVLIGSLQTCGATCIDPPKTKVEVHGVVRATAFRTKRICYDNTGCTSGFTGTPAGILSPLHYAGTPTLTGADTGSRFGRSGGGILCPDNRGLLGFEAADEVCTPSARVANPANYGACTAGLYPTGVTATGQVICN